MSISWFRHFYSVASEVASRGHLLPNQRGKDLIGSPAELLGG